MLLPVNRDLSRTDNLWMEKKKQIYNIRYPQHFGEEEEKKHTRLMRNKFVILKFFLIVYYLSSSSFFLDRKDY